MSESLPDYEVLSDGTIVHLHRGTDRVVHAGIIPPDDGIDWDRALLDAGYIHCRPHDEWHRPPECAIRQDGTPAPWWEARRD